MWVEKDELFGFDFISINTESDKHNFLNSITDSLFFSEYP